MPKLYVSCIVVALLALAVMPALAVDDSAEVNLTVDNMAEVFIGGMDVALIQSSPGPSQPWKAASTHLLGEVNLYVGPSGSADDDAGDLLAPYVESPMVFVVRSNYDVVFDFGFDGSGGTDPWGGGSTYWVCPPEWMITTGAGSWGRPRTHTNSPWGATVSDWEDNRLVRSQDAVGVAFNPATDGRTAGTGGAAPDDWMTGVFTAGSGGPKDGKFGYVILKIDAPDGKLVADLAVGSSRIGTATITLSEAP